MGRLGRALIALGILVLLFAAYQLWGTGIEAARAQDDLKSEFNKALSATTTPAPTTTSPPPTGPTTSNVTTLPPTTTSLATAPAPPREGDALARIDIPRIGTNWIVVEGVATPDLRKGPGHYPGTPVPGQIGNVAIAGHRTTYGAPFERVDELKPGDEVAFTTVTGHYVYRVTGQQIVGPSDTSVLANTPEPTLTLTSCHPKYSASQRIIVTASLDRAASSPVLAAAGATPAPTVAPTSAPATSTPAKAGQSTTPATAPATNEGDSPVVTTSLPAAGTFSDGWVSDPNAWSGVAVWGILLTGIAVGAWLLGRRIPQWAAALLGLIPFLIVLYFFFDNVNRLLPPNL